MLEFDQPGPGWVFVKVAGLDDSGFLEWVAGHPDGFVVVSERRPRPPRVVLHRATCDAIGAGAPHDSALGRSYLRVCGLDGAVLEEHFAASEVRHCPLCRGAAGSA
jgi:hypothetical protein